MKKTIAIFGISALSLAGLSTAHADVSIRFGGGAYCPPPPVCVPVAPRCVPAPPVVVYAPPPRVIVPCPPAFVPPPFCPPPGLHVRLPFVDFRFGAPRHGYARDYGHRGHGHGHGHHR